MKHRLSKRVILALALCAACVLAFGATFAQAVVDSNMGGDNELTMRVMESDSDVKDANVQLRVYRVATASADSRYDTYNYTFDVEPFTKLGEGYDAQTMTDDSWKSMAEAAKKIVDEQGVEPDVTAPAGETISGLANGLYLVLVPDASTEKYTYTFTPALVALPGKVGTMGEPEFNTASGSWTNKVEAIAKWSRKAREGSLKINKSITSYNGEPATFTFHITGTTDNGDYENYASVTFTDGSDTRTTVGGIPAGYEYTVTEVDDGAAYQAVGSNEQRVTVTADQTAEVQATEVNFTNELDPNNPGKVGHGIENHFVYDENYNGGDWRLEVRAIDASEANPGA